MGFHDPAPKAPFNQARLARRCGAGHGLRSFHTQQLPAFFISGAVNDCHISVDGKFILSIGMDKRMKITNIQGGRTVASKKYAGVQPSFAFAEPSLSSVVKFYRILGQKHRGLKFSCLQIHVRQNTCSYKLIGC